MRRRAYVMVGVLGCLVLAMLVWQPTGANFSRTTTDGPGSLTAAADFEVGSLATWGGQHLQSTPLQIGSLTTWSSVAGADYSSCAIRTDGTLWCAGADVYGQLGLGDTVSRVGFTQVGTATTWTTVGVGNNGHACGLQSDTTLWCWGLNSRGQIADGTATNRLVPTQIITPATTGWSTLSVGWTQNCSVRSDTTLWCWGSNIYGQLGQGNSTTYTTTKQVKTPALTGWTGVATGDRHTCATMTGGVLYCWGNNTYGQLGQGTTTTSTTPIQVPGTT